jgi:hypothetical protein
MDEKYISGAMTLLTARFPVTERERIEKGVAQAARFWRGEDGDGASFEEFCSSNFFTGPELDTLFTRFEDKLEQIRGHFNALQLALRHEMDEDTGENHPVDNVFAAFSPGAHLEEDMFQSKLAFMVLLNFPIRTLEECLAQGVSWNRGEWARTRLAQGFAQRVPAEVAQNLSKAYSDADSYIYSYNIYMDHVAGADGKPAFRDGLRLISHWGLRDELRALYTDAKGNLPAQRLIHTIMRRIVAQEIPQSVINSKSAMWDPVANTVDGKPADPEPDTRYAHMLSIFKAHRLEDRHYPLAPTHVDRRFNINREIPEKEVSAMLEMVLLAPAGKKTAEIIEKRLGRTLEPFDIWYDGFKARGSMNEGELDKKVAEKYPSLEAFQKDIPGILKKLGFDAATANFLAERIEVDPARGAGHAWGPGMRGEKAHLRTRGAQNGMDYQGFNTAMHELGHCVEQTFSTYKVDSQLLKSMPNTAFTEGFAFVFQARDLEILGLGKPDKQAELLKTLDTFWSTREIAAVALVDMQVWNWLYKHPKATPARLKKAVITIAKDTWNKYNAPVFGVKDSPLLGIYSHMINSGLYLPDYPLGYIIAFQVEDYFKTHSLAQDMERMCITGSVTPAEWMRQAVGGPMSAHPLVDAALKAAQALAG